SIERQPRKVKVDEFTILKVDLPYIWIRISCSRGTYVRTLCHDLGQKIGCGAILVELTRLRIGNFNLNNAISLESITSKEDLAKHIISIAEALDLPYVIVSKHGENIFRNGGKILKDEIKQLQDGTNELVKVLNEEGEFLGLATIQRTAAGPYIVPRRVFC
ncbi:MAG TPA: tRNA pseudouridine(55) synthase TruB, partial [Candidatus Hydrogenedens sp.]|nr:tRNA pseudouridine(55) synthase TruB [Candidatus Hydrogenedens sp.]